MPTMSAMERVKLLANRDTSSPDALNDAQLQDALVQFPNIFAAAAHVCRVRAAYWDLGIPVSAAGVSYDPGQRHDRLMAKAKEFDAMAASGKGGGKMTMYVGGSSHDDNESLDNDTDLVQPKFRIDGDSFHGQYGDEDDRFRGRY